jgi:hypothetical protein
VFVESVGDETAIKEVAMGCDAIRRSGVRLFTRRLDVEVTETPQTFASFPLLSTTYGYYWFSSFCI